MNELGARAVAWQGQFIGQFRKVHRARWETVCEDGEPIRFNDPFEAECAGWRVLRKHMGEVQGWRAPEQSDKWAEAEKHFRKVGHGEADRT